MEHARLNNTEDMFARIDFNSKSGFGSIGRVLKAVKRQGNTSISNTRSVLLGKFQIRQRKRAKQQGICVSCAPLGEIQIGLAAMAEGPHIYAPVAIDIFLQLINVVPLQSSLPEETADAIDEVRIGIGHPRSVMVVAGGEFQHDVRERLKYYGVRTQASRTLVIVVERAIRALKERIQTETMPLEIIMGPNTSLMRLDRLIPQSV